MRNHTIIWVWISCEMPMTRIREWFNLPTVSAGNGWHLYRMDEDDGITTAMHVLNVP